MVSFCLKLILPLLPSFLLVNCNTIWDFNKLVKSLQTNYSKTARPKVNQSEPVKVQIGFVATAMRELDEVKERFSIVGVVLISWNDEVISWNPDENGGMNSIVVDNDMFWSPSITVQNSVESQKKIGHESFWKVIYYSNGDGLFRSSNVFTSMCSTNVKYYPWDQQTCTLYFTVIGYTGLEVKLEPYPEIYISPFAYYSENSIWEMIEKSSGLQEGYNSVYVAFKMKRKPMFVIVNVIIPIVFVSLLNILVFLIPAESGERVSYCLTVLLAIAVFLTLVADAMPKSSSSLLSYYLIAILGHSVIITFEIILNQRMYYRDEDETVPRYLSFLVKSLRRPICFRRHKAKQTKLLMQNEKVDCERITQEDIPIRSTHSVQLKSLTESSGVVNNLPVVTSMDPAQGTIPDTICVHKDELKIPQKFSAKQKMIVSWKHVTTIFESILFFISFCLFLAINITFFLVVPQ